MGSFRFLIFAFGFLLCSGLVPSEETNDSSTRDSYRMSESDSDGITTAIIFVAIFLYGGIGISICLFCFCVGLAICVCIKSQQQPEGASGGMVFGTPQQFFGGNYGYQQPGMMNPGPGEMYMYPQQEQQPPPYYQPQVAQKEELQM